jgi:hypothetical protein
MSGQLRAPVALLLKTPGTRAIAGRMGPRHCHDVWEKRKSFTAEGIRTPNRPTRRPVIVPTTVARLLLSLFLYYFLSVFFRGQFRCFSGSARDQVHTDTYHETLSSVGYI